MSPPKRETTPAGRYDQALNYARDQRLPPGFVSPRPTKDWPPENIALLERYVEWLASGGASENVIRTIYIPMAGHVLGLNLKPHPQLDLQADLQKAMDYVLAKQMGPDWTDVCRVSLEKFRRFLLNERGQVQLKFTPYDARAHTQGLPGWLADALVRYQQIKQRNWREARLQENIRRFWDGYLRTWRFLVGQCGILEIKDLKRQHLYDYAAMRLASGHAVTGVNGDLRSFHAFMAFLQDQGYEVPQALFRVQCLKEPDPLPRFLTDEQVKKLRDEFEGRVQRAKTSVTRRDALLDRAAFYLLWQSGLRRGEVEELRLDDLDLPGKRLTVRRGKSLIDRTVYLTDATVQALQTYLQMRGLGPTDHVFLYRNQPLSKDLIHGRLKAAGERVGVKVHAHRLRHTAATQLLNAGCRITSIQKFLGHKELNTTMIYARVHDQTVANDYYAAMSVVEKRLELAGQQVGDAKPLIENQRCQLLSLANRLAEPELSVELRLDIAAQMVGVLSANIKAPMEISVRDYQESRLEHPPPSSVFSEANLD